MAKQTRPDKTKAGPKKVGDVYVGEPTGGDEGAGAGTVETPQNLSFPSWSEITETLKQIKTLLDILVAVLGAQKGQLPDGVRPQRGCDDWPGCPDAAGPHYLVCNNGTKSWQPVPGAMASPRPTGMGTEPEDEAGGN